MYLSSKMLLFTVSCKDWEWQGFYLTCPCQWGQDASVFTILTLLLVKGTTYILMSLASLLYIWFPKQYGKQCYYLPRKWKPEYVCGTSHTSMLTCLSAFYWEWFKETKWAELQSICAYFLPQSFVSLLAWRMYSCPSHLSTHILLFSKPKFPFFFFFYKTE